MERLLVQIKNLCINKNLKVNDSEYIPTAIESLLEGQAEALTQTAISKALEGDGLALRLCMERIAPAPKDQPVSFNLPKMSNALDASEAAGRVLS